MEELVSEEEPPGGTPFFKAVRLGKNLHLNNLFVKFEGANRTGTQKDRISRLHVQNAIMKGYDTISLATCGNYGASISYYSGLHGLKSVVGMPEHYAQARLQEMSLNGSEIVKIAGKYEEAVEYMSDLATLRGWYDSNPGSSNSEMDIKGYEGIAYEIVDQLGHSPEFLAVPVGNGTTLSGIYSGFRRMKNLGLIDVVPRMIGASTSNGNPIVEAWNNGHSTVMDLPPESIIETGVNEPLIAYRSIDGQKALDAIRESRGMALYVNDLDMIRYSRLAETSEGISVLPASASAIAAVQGLLQSCCAGREIVVVVTGRNQIWTTR